MRTIKRSIPDINTNAKNYDKYFNQLSFEGIVHSQDIYTVNQNSFADAKNVYVDNGVLMSRPVLISTHLSESLPEGHILKEVIPINHNIMIIITQNMRGIPYYRITIDDSDKTTLLNIMRYKLVTINNYIICFNNLGAKAIDINNVNAGWFPLSDIVDVPITKRVVGSNETKLPENKFTKSYKEQYILSTLSNPILPNGNADVEINTTSKKYEFKLENANELTDLRILKSLDRRLGTDGILTAAKDTVCIGYDDYVYVSYNQGETFTRLVYPAHGKFLNIASVSEDDGAYYFFVATEGVYRCNLADRTWTIIETGFTSEGNRWFIPEEYEAPINCCHFKTKDIFAFVLTSPVRAGSNYYCYEIACYEFGPGLLGNMDDDIHDDKHLNRGIFDISSEMDENSFRCRKFMSAEEQALSKGIRVKYDESTELCSLVFIWPIMSVPNLYEPGKTSQYKIFIEVPDSTTGYHRYRKGKLLNDNFNLNNGFGDFFTFSINNFEVLSYDNTNNEVDYRLCLFGYKGDSTQTWQYITLDITLLNTTQETLNVEEITELNIDLNFRAQPTFHFLYKVLDGWIFGNYVFTEDFTKSFEVPQLSTNPQPGRPNVPIVIVDNGYFYAVHDNTIWTNKFNDNDAITLTYNYLAQDDLFTEIPDITYSDTELYMTFGNKLRITKNIYDKEKLLLNLPEINDQVFVENITAMLNISTTEIAIFFENKVVICSRVEDQNFSYRYDYHNSRLSIGVRLGDSVVNTLEGKYTVIPTQRGLAFMSYQEFMATSDQTLTYLSDSIRDIWYEFYAEYSSGEGSSGDLGGGISYIWYENQINIKQWRDYLIITNGSKRILLLQLTNSKINWWYWEVPFRIEQLLIREDIIFILSKQLSHLSEEPTELYAFDSKSENDRYWDFPKTNHQQRINWHIQSQPLHMSAPNYYKSIRQLVFQLVETTKDKTTIKAQVKLYRKKLTIREPETVAFKIEELRTFVKRFNYWKVNELQWSLSNDEETATPAQLKLNGISVKYEYGEEVK